MITKSFDLQAELQRLIRLETSGVASDQLREGVVAQALLLLVMDMEALEASLSARVYCICEKSWRE